jgi:murein DD-endopeptidase MepM/ murein hydrolase activator NlpD
MPVPGVRRRHLGVVAAVVLGLVLSLGVPAQADNEQDLRRKAQRLQAQIKAQSGDVGATTRKVQVASMSLAGVQAQLPGARQAVAEAEGQLVAAKAEDQARAHALVVARAQQTKAADAVVEIQARIDSAYDYVGRIARAAYTQGAYAELAVALQAQSPDDLAGRLSAMDSIGRAENVLLDSMAVDQADLKIKQQELDLAEAEVARQRAQAAVQLQHTNALAEKARAAQAKVEALVAQARRVLAIARVAKAKELANLRKLKQAQAKVKQQLAAASRGSGLPSGELLWPADGPVTEGVGPRIHPVYGYRSCHTGIDIGAGYGSTIRAALGGTVIAEYFNTAYGNVTLIDHGDGLSTFYAHQSARVVGVGAHVRKGQPIGRVGATGFATGPHLHFEVHVNGVPFDPMGWFGGAKVPVRC